MLESVNVALGVTGSIAAVTTVELAHELRRHGASVRAVMTPAARSIIHPWSLEFATENPVVTEITGDIEHVELCGVDGWADVMLLAPATANTLGKMAAAIDDTPVTTTVTTAFGSETPIVAVPAMHEPMYNHPGVMDSLETLESWGVELVEPRVEEGKAKIAEESTIVTELARAVGPNPLAGKRVVVTSGSTTESIDPIRTLSNRASGRTGRAVARACYVRGADVVLVHDGPDLSWATVERVESSTEMLDAVRSHAESADALVSAAAISDYTTETTPEKIRSGQETLTLELEPTPKLIDAIRESYPDLPIVGFKAEVVPDDTDDQSADEAIIEQARHIQERANLAFVVGNDARVMGQDRTRALFVWEDEYETFEGSKDDLGERVAAHLSAALYTDGQKC